MDVKAAVLQSWKNVGHPEKIDREGMQTVPDILLKAVSRYQHAPAMTCLGHTMSYLDLDKLSSKFAAWLQHSTQLKPGDRIAIQLPNLSQYSIVAYGALKAGLVLVNVNPMYTERELEYQFDNAEVKAVVVFDQFLAGVEAVVPKTQVENIIVVSPFDIHSPIKRTVMNFLMKLMGKRVATGSHHRLVSILNDSDISDYQPIEKSASDIAVLQYTGGTTGVSKPAILTHNNLVMNMLQGWYGLSSGSLTKGEEKIVAPLPIYHIYSFALVLTIGVYMGSHTLLIPDPRNIKAFIKALKKFPCTILSGLNTLFLALMNNPGFNQVDFSATKLVLSGGMALTEGVAKEWKVRTGLEICEGYGLTETSPVVALTQSSGVVLGSVGLILPETEVRIVDDHGNDLPTEEHGELWVKGPQVMQGYWKFPDETAKVLTPEGWLKTGDIASIDTLGYLRIHDRQKDMILVSGFNVYPNEVEGVLSTHPDIQHCAAIAEPDLESGEVVKVFIVTSNPQLTEKQVKEYCQQQLATYKVPKIVEFRDELPLSNVGKVLRNKLRD